MEILDPCLPPLANAPSTELIQARAQIASLKMSVDRLTARVAKTKQDNETAANIERERVARIEVGHLSAINALTEQRDEMNRLRWIALDDRDAQVQRASESESARAAAVTECERLHADRKAAGTFHYELKIDTSAARLALEELAAAQREMQRKITEAAEEQAVLEQSMCGNAEQPLSVAHVLLRRAGAETDDGTRLAFIREAREWVNLAR